MAKGLLMKEAELERSLFSLVVKALYNLAILYSLSLNDAGPASGFHSLHVEAPLLLKYSVSPVFPAMHSFPYATALSCLQSSPSSTCQHKFHSSFRTPVRAGAIFPCLIGGTPLSLTEQSTDPNVYTLTKMVGIALVCVLLYISNEMLRARD